MPKTNVFFLIDLDQDQVVDTWHSIREFHSLEMELYTARLSRETGHHYAIAKSQIFVDPVRGTHE